MLYMEIVFILAVWHPHTFFYCRIVQLAGLIQTTVVISIAKAKYVGEYNAAKELVFLANSLKKIGYKRSNVDTILLFANN